MKKSLNHRHMCAVLVLLVAASFTACQSTTARTAASLRRLQGSWEGTALSRKSPGGPYVKSEPPAKITITITGNSLYFKERSNFWYDATFTLPAGTNPQHLQATIKRSAEGDQASDSMIIAFYKIEDGTLTLGGIRDKDSTTPWPKSFEAAEDTMTGRYELRKVQPQKQNTLSAKYK